MTEQVGLSLCREDRELLEAMARDIGIRRAGAMARIIVEDALDKERAKRARRKKKGAR